MPVYNSGRYLSKSVDSILQQTFGDFEFIVVDDGSTDDTLERVQEFAKADRRIRVLAQQNCGVTGALNAGVRHARGEFIGRMDAGDVSLPERFRAQVQALRTNARCVAIGSHYQLIDDQYRVVCTRRPSSDHDLLVAALMGRDRRGGGIPHAGAMIRRAAMQCVGFYRAEFRFAQDRDLWLRMCDIGQLSNVPEVLLQVMITPTAGISSVRATEQRSYALMAIRDAYQRKGDIVPPSFDLWPVPERAADVANGLVWAAIREQNFDAARCSARTLIRLAPFEFSTWRAACRAYLGVCGEKMARIARRYTGDNSASYG